LGKIRKELKMMERGTSKRKKNFRNNLEGKRRNQAKKSEIREWTKEDEDKIGNIVNPNYEL